MLAGSCRGIFRKQLKHVIGLEELRVKYKGRDLKQGNYINKLTKMVVLRMCLLEMSLKFILRYDFFRRLGGSVG